MVLPGRLVKKWLYVAKSTRIVIYTTMLAMHHGNVKSKESQYSVMTYLEVVEDVSVMHSLLHDRV